MLETAQKRLTFTMPGKAGDALHQYVAAFWYHQQSGKTFDLWLDEHTCKPLVNLFAAQPCVDDVLLKPGIENWSMGGQPWDWALSLDDHAEREFQHLGFRRFPTRQITLEVLDQVPLHIERGASSNCLAVTPLPTTKRRAVLHGTFTSHASGVPGFWRFLSSIRAELEQRFDEIVFVGTAAERSRALEIYPDWLAFNDDGDFLKLAEYMAGAKLVIGAGSSNVVLASLLGIPCVRVHDPIGDYPKVIWSGLGENQINDTERELRSTWPVFRDEFVDAPQPAALTA